MMLRRGFLGAMAAAVAGATLDPERALWVPGARLISVPSTLSRAIAAGFFRVGDVITFGADPHEYVVTKVARDTVQYSALDVAPPLFLHGAVFGHPFGARRVGRVTGTRAG